MPKILIVDDEKEIVKGLAINLTREGFEVIQAFDGKEGLDLAIKERPDLILGDVAMPGMNGLDMCRELRKKGIEIPIILLTARAEEIDRVLGLELGADDYVTKPFSLRELLARIRARLRRPTPNAAKDLSAYHFGNVQIDFEKCQATKNDDALDLTQREFAILKLLIRCRGEVVTRDRMLDEVWGYQAYPTTRTVDTHILKLRQKIEDDPSEPKSILSVYGGGYKFVD
jgi:DNA-binding response OmpR family regulator